MTSKKMLMVDTDVINGLMEQRGITKSQLAKKLKMSERSVNKFLSADNQASYSIVYLFKMARCLDVDILTLLHKDHKVAI